MRILCVVGAILLLSLGFEKNPPKKIDLPEEIQLAKVGDTLEVYRVTRSTIYIGFHNKRNR